jgi:prolipoprotein diacylglyceryltransferase
MESTIFDVAALFFGLFWIFFCILYFVIVFGGAIFWVFMLVDAVQRENYKNKDDKTIWIIVLALTGLIGAAIYYFAIKRKLPPVK